MLSDSGIYRIDQTGEITVLAFGEDGVPDHLFYPECKQDLLSLVEKNHCRVLVFDLADVRFLASGMLGLLLWLQKRGVEVRLRNVAVPFQQTLQTLQLDRVLHIENTIPV